MATLTVTATQTPTLTATPTASATPTVTSAVTITYRLTQGSTIVFVPPTPAATPPAPELLSGTFTVVRSQPRPPNTIFAFTITSIDLQGGSEFTVTNGTPMPIGCASEISLGCVQSLTIDFPPRVYMTVLVSINGGNNLELVGGGLLDSASDPPTFNNLTVCGGPQDQAISCDAVRNGTEPGFAITISAVPED